jgi:hypothetical protein
MAIKLKKNGEFVYTSQTGLVSESERKKADLLYKEIQKSIYTLEKKLLKKQILTREGRKKNALRVWFEFGKLLHRIVKKYNIIGTPDEEFFWQSIYDHVSPIVQKKPMPKRSKNWKQNHFRLCFLMAKNRNWESVKSVGNWSLWREIFDNKKILEDERLFNWTVNKIIKLRKQGMGHKKIRPFLYEISKRFKRIDTNLLTNKELTTKLQDLKIQRYKKSDIFFKN